MTILVIVLCVGLGIGTAAMVVAAANSPRKMHSILLKLLLNHLITMSVCSSLLQLVLAHVGAKGLLNKDIVDSAYSVAGYFDLFDGTMPSEWTMWSMTCLMTPGRTAEQELLFEQIANAGHTEFFSSEMAMARAELEKVAWTMEFNRLLIW